MAVERSQTVNMELIACLETAVLILVAQNTGRDKSTRLTTPDSTRQSNVKHMEKTSREIIDGRKQHS